MKPANIVFMPLALLVLFQPRTLAETDTENLVNRLMARRSSLSEATVRYDSYSLKMTKEAYQRFNAAISSSRSQNCAHMAKLVREFIAGDDVRPLISRFGDFFYKDNRWRIKQNLSNEFPRQREQLEKMANGCASLLEPLAAEDVAFTGEYLMALEDNKTLFYRDPAKSPDYLKTADFDMSLADWHMVIEKRPNVGQTISTSNRNGKSVITFASKMADGEGSYTDYEFDPSVGYGPTRVYGDVRGRAVLEILYAYESNSGGGVPTPCLTSHAEFRRDGSIWVRALLIKQWLPHVDEKDLSVQVPEKYVLVNERFGNVPLMVEQDESIAAGLPGPPSFSNSPVRSGEPNAGGVNVPDRTTQHPNAPSAPLLETRRPANRYLWLLLLPIAAILFLLAVSLLKRQKATK